MMSPAATSSSPRRIGVENQAAGDGSGAPGSDVVAALCHLAEVIDQRLQFGSLCGEEWGIEMQGVRRRVGAA
jgi:hypothetical protein